MRENFNPSRKSTVEQYVVFQLKVMELLHLILLSSHLTDTGDYPKNDIGHGVDQFKETLMGAAVNAFMAISDTPKSTNIRWIWKQLYLNHAKAIDRIWERQISPGETLMKAYRDQAGVHGDRPHKYFAGKLGLFRDERQVQCALDNFLGLYICLLKRQAREVPELASETESALLEIELNNRWTFNRRWLRKMRLVEGGRKTIKFP